MSETLSMHGVADLLDLHYDTVRKEWRGWRRAANFPSPAPINRRSYRWSRQAILDWLARTSDPKPGRAVAPPSHPGADAWAQLDRVRERA
jgi:predicted DNA-binding transcriptional regulator AlpA